MPISIELISVLIWGVPLVLLGFLFGTGYFKKLIPPSGCVLMVAGWVMGMATMIAIAFLFPVAAGAFLVDAAIGLWWNQLIGRQPANVIYINPWLLLVGAIVVISAVISIAYDKMVRPHKE
jgi:hypothetical protein